VDLAEKTRLAVNEWLSVRGGKGLGEVDGTDFDGEKSGNFQEVT
jgi:hypothetical protein